MKITFGARATGKTHQLIIRSAESGYPIVVHGQPLVNYILTQAKKMGLNIPRPIFYRDLIEKKFDGLYFGEKILLDNAELILIGLFNFCEIEEATIGGSDKTHLNILANARREQHKIDEG